MSSNAVYLYIGILLGYFGGTLFNIEIALPANFIIYIDLGRLFKFNTIFRASPFLCRRPK
jgi:hypothetical protein